MSRRAIAMTLLAAAALVTACGHGSSKQGSSGGSLAAESQSAATGDIPDNQVFLTFHDPSAGYSIKHPEGWARTGAASHVTFRDKDNFLRVVVTRGSRPTPATVRSAVTKRAKGGSDRRARAASVLSIHGARVVKVTYTMLGAPNPVTGKRAELVIDRYVFARGGRVATVDLGTPRGVDNVDAYRMISRSFTWQ